MGNIDKEVLWNYRGFRYFRLDIRNLRLNYKLVCYDLD